MRSREWARCCQALVACSWRSPPHSPSVILLLLCFVLDCRSRSRGGDPQGVLPVRRRPDRHDIAEEPPARVARAGRDAERRRAPGHDRRVRQEQRRSHRHRGVPRNHEGNQHLLIKRWKHTSPFYFSPLFSPSSHFCAAFFFFSSFFLLFCTLSNASLASTKRKACTLSLFKLPLRSSNPRRSSL